MKPPPFAYHAPRSVEEALTLLAALDGAKVLAGGQSLVPLLNMRLAEPAALIDIGRIPGLDVLEVTDGHVRIGAGVTHERLRRDDAVAAVQPLLRRALDLVAHPVIRNRGTTVGSVVHADPAAEMPAVVALLGGTLEVASVRGRRSIEAADLVRGPLESDVAPDELALELRVPVAAPGTGSAFVELSRRHGDYALAGVATEVAVDGGRIVGARATFIGVGTGTAVLDLSPAVAGRDAAGPDVVDVAAAVAGFVEPQDDVHADAAYRRHLAGVLAGRAVRAAAADALARAGAGVR